MAAFSGRAACAGIAVACCLSIASPAFAETLFRIITVKDEIVVGLNDKELAELGSDAGALARSIAGRGSVSLWQYAVRQGKDGQRLMAPLQKVGLLAANSLRVEPYKSPFAVLPHD
jgi:hypothetical protein